MGNLKELRIKLGLTQEGVAVRALTTGEVRPTFNGVAVRRAEQPNPIGLRSYELRVGLALGLGLPLDDLNLFLGGKLSVDQAAARSSIKPDPEAVRKLEMADAERAQREKRAAALGEGASYAATHPNLASTVAWCREQFPLPFLEEYVEAVVPSGGDRPHAVWYDDIRVKYWEWSQKGSKRRADPVPAPAAPAPAAPAPAAPAPAAPKARKAGESRSSAASGRGGGKRR
jgi:hypothetical protein